VAIQINSLLFYFLPLQLLDCHVTALRLLAMTFMHFKKQTFLSLVGNFKLPWGIAAYFSLKSFYANVIVTIA
jgi:hypothetical protein